MKHQNQRSAAVSDLRPPIRFHLWPLPCTFTVLYDNDNDVEDDDDDDDDGEGLIVNFKLPP